MREREPPAQGGWAVWASGWKDSLWAANGQVSMGCKVNLICLQHEHHGGI
jgi:hypothetical protein